MNGHPRDFLSVIIDDYNKVILSIEEKARASSKRAYGGIIRAEKGRLVEKIGKELIKIAWDDLGMEQERISFRKKIIRIPLKAEYIKRVKSPEIREYIKKTFIVSITP